MKNLRRLLFSVVVLALSLAAGVGATVAYFTDTQTSLDNKLTAGKLNLSVGNYGYLNKVLQDGSGDTTDLTWDFTDLSSEVFFNFLDLTPGDFGEDLISLRLADSGGWLCANAVLTSAADNAINEPESSAGDSTDGASAGELQDEINFILWGDDGDGVLEANESVFQSGAMSDFGFSPGSIYILNDSTKSNLFGIATGSAVPSGSTSYVGFGWCYGTLAQNAQSPAVGDPTSNTGFTCSGSGATNLSQSDSVDGTLAFYAIQSANNTGFTCSSWSL